MEVSFDGARHILSESKIPQELAHAAQVLAASADPEQHRVLFEYLRNENFRERLDPPDEPDTGPKDRWLAKPLYTLEGNTAPSAHSTLAMLMSDKNFNEDPDCTDLLVEVSASLRPPSEEVVAFWRKYATPESGHLQGIVKALLDNGDELAVLEFERILLNTKPDPDDDDYRIDWLRRWVLKHRDNDYVLSMVERLVSNDFPAPWTKFHQLAAAEVIFMHEKSWYRINQVVLPPPVAKISPTGQNTIRRIGKIVKEKLHPDRKLRVAIDEMISSLNTDRQSPQ